MSSFNFNNNKSIAYLFIEQISYKKKVKSSYKYDRDDQIKRCIFFLLLLKKEYMGYRTLRCQIKEKIRVRVF